MATTQATQAIPTATTRARRRFTVEEYHRMAEAGILGEDERVELLDGDVVEMSPVGDPHVEGVNRCGRAYAAAWAAGRLGVSTQNPPRLGEVLLAIEVADTSAADDRARKVPLYGRAGVPEAWLLDVVARRLEVYREPGPDGYAWACTLQPEQQVACEAFPDIVVRVADLLPPRGL